MINHATKRMRLRSYTNLTVCLSQTTVSDAICYKPTHFWHKVLFFCFNHNCGSFLSTRLGHCGEITTGIVFLTRSLFLTLSEYKTVVVEGCWTFCMRVFFSGKVIKICSFSLRRNSAGGFKNPPKFWENWRYRWGPIISGDLLSLSLLSFSLPLFPPFSSPYLLIS